MGSQSPLTIPIIDFSELIVGCPKWNLVKAEVKEALEGYGCFEAFVPNIPIDLGKALFGSLEELFDLPSETKQKITSKKPYHGYVQHPTLPLFESMEIEEILVSEKRESFTNLLWPQGNADFRKTIESWSDQLFALDRTVRRMVWETLEMEDYMNELMDSEDYILRMMKYEEPKTAEKKVGLHPHTDLNIATILYQNQVGGLQVLTKDGEWINVTSTQDSFIFMAGVSLHAWTNGRIHSPCHRVMMKGDETRYSIGLFATPKDGFMIKAPEKLIDEQHPLLYKPFDYNKFEEFVYLAPGFKEKTPLETYCGV